MKFEFRKIMEGAFNSIFINAKIEEIAKERMDICNVCPHMSENKRKDPNFKSIRPDKFYCTLCGCNLHMKTRSLSSFCPDKPARWDKLIEEKEEWELDSKIAQEKVNTPTRTNSRF